MLLLTSFLTYQKKKKEKKGFHPLLGWIALGLGNGWGFWGGGHGNSGCHGRGFLAEFDDCALEV
jgi:hypothetical protein